MIDPGPLYVLIREKRKKWANNDLSIGFNAGLECAIAVIEQYHRTIQANALAETENHNGSTLNPQQLDKWRKLLSKGPRGKQALDLTDAEVERIRLGMATMIAAQIAFNLMYQETQHEDHQDPR